MGRRTSDRVTDSLGRSEEPGGLDRGDVRSEKPELVQCCAEARLHVVDEANLKAFERLLEGGRAVAPRALEPGRHQAEIRQHGVVAVFARELLRLGKQATPTLRIACCRQVSDLRERDDDAARMVELEGERK